MSNKFNALADRILEENTVTGGVFGGSSEIGAHGGAVGNSDWYAPNDARNVFGLDVVGKKKGKKGKKKSKALLMPVQRRPMIKEGSYETIRKIHGYKKPQEAFRIQLPDGSSHRKGEKLTIVYAHTPKQAIFKFADMFPNWKFRKNELKAKPHVFRDKPEVTSSLPNVPKSATQPELFKLQ